MKLEGHIRGFEHVFVNLPIVVTCYLFSILFNNTCAFFRFLSLASLIYKTRKDSNFGEFSFFKNIFGNAPS